MMRHLLTIIIISILGCIGLVIVSAKCVRHMAEAQSCGTTIDKEVTEVVGPDELYEVGDEADFVYYGDTLYQYDGKTVVIDCTEEDLDVSSLTSSRIVTYIDTIPVSRSKVVGSSMCSVDGPILEFAVGVDTVRYDLRNLPDTLNPSKALLPENVVEHKYVRSFALTECSWDCNFKFLAYLPENYPAWLNQFIAIVMRNDIKGLYHDNKGADRILKEYYGIKSTPKMIDEINTSGMGPEQIARHFAHEHERIYKDEFPVEDYDGHGPKYDYMMEVAPVWSSENGSHVTYRFYTFYYTGGMHGFMEEYYLTFNNQTGELLGYDDIIGKNNFPRSIAVLEKQLTFFRSTRSSITDTYPAALDSESLEANASEIIKEKYNGSYYPRPAITRQGIVFTYQPYEKGAFSDGILHFVQPYPEGFRIK